MNCQKVNTIDTPVLVRKRDYDNKIGEIKGKIASIISLVAAAALSAVKNKIQTLKKQIIKVKYQKLTKNISS